MHMSNSFVAIDFETANSFRGSACEIGLYRVIDGEFDARLDSLIRPHPKYPDFDFVNVSVHGIQAEDVQDAPEFGELWPSVKSFIGDLPLVAHSVAFDIRVLRELFFLYGIPAPLVQYFCTLVLSRRVLELASYSLSFVAHDLGIQQAILHRGGSDAECAADIALALLLRSGQADLATLAESVNVSAGRFDGETWFSSQGNRRRDGSPHFSAAMIAEIRSSLSDATAADPDGELFGHRVAFTGGLASMTRAEAASRVLRAGGEPQTGVNKHTDFLVVGAENGYTIDPRTATTNKFEKATKLNAKGSKIEILDELSFTRML
jgi:DNA polymerase III epsilon subunit-like protein